jgi:streptogramin lyase
VTVRTHVEIGDDFLGYRIEELIGRGGMGVVYRAYDLRLKRTVALKLVSPEYALDDRSRARFARESEIAMSLEHPNVVPIHDAGEVDGRLYLAMRLVEGADLRAVLRDGGALEPARALAICGPVAAALDAAHARGLVHRDVKPSNILLDANEHVCLADFGLTRPLDEQGVEPGDGRSLGTPAYLAPEQISGEAVDGRADVYSLGCLLYECLTGETPYPRGSRLAVTWAHLEEEAPRASVRNRDLPEALDAVLGRALAKEPDERYPTCAALIAAAQRALGLGQRPVSRRGKVLVLVGVVAVLAALAFALAAAVRRGGSEPPATPQRLVGDWNTLVRVDPERERVSAVIEVGKRPTAVAVAAGAVWVYNAGDSTLSEVDPRTNSVRRTISLSTSDLGSSALVGPALAADRGGAWVIGVDDRDVPLLTRVPRGGGRKREYRLGVRPRAVAVGFGAVWVVGQGTRRNEVLRIDPGTGRITGRAVFPKSAGIDGILLDFGAVWVTDSARAVLHRIDRRTGRRRGQVDLGERGQRPFANTFGGVAVSVSDDGGITRIVDDSSLEIRESVDCCPPEWGHSVVWNALPWSYDWPTASVLRWLTPTSAVSTRISDGTPVSGGPCLTAIAGGAGALWVTAAPPTSWNCSD